MIRRALVTAVMSVSKLHTVCVEPSSEHTASLIFLHGSGDTGKGIKNWIDQVFDGGFCFKHIKVIFPTAPIRQYTLIGKMPMNVWFDRSEMSLQCREDLKSIDEVCQSLDQIVLQEINSGISLHRIIVGGLSMGGAMALHYCFRPSVPDLPSLAHNPPALSTEGPTARGRSTASGGPPCIRAMFVLSGFLSQSSRVFDTLRQSDGAENDNVRRVYPYIYQAHGALDSLVLLDWGETTHRTLTQLINHSQTRDRTMSQQCSSAGTGVMADTSSSDNSHESISAVASGGEDSESSDSGVGTLSGVGTFKVYQDLGHEMSYEEIKHLREWILTVLG